MSRKVVHMASCLHYTYITLYLLSSSFMPLIPNQMTISTSNKFKIWLDKSKIHDTKFREWADLKIESLYKYIKASDVIPVTGWNLARKFGCNLAHTPVDTFGVKEIHKVYQFSQCSNGWYRNYWAYAKDTASVSDFCSVGLHWSDATRTHFLKLYHLSIQFTCGW